MAQEEILQNGTMPVEEENSNFDLMEWVVRIIRYWYLFVIAAVIALSLAFLKNKRVIERYLTTGTMIIKESSGAGYGSASIMQGFGVGAGYTNVNNQLIIIGSYDLIGRTVDSLSFMNVEYITKGRFKTRNIYRNTPITVEYTHLDPSVYGHLFRCQVQDDGSLLITTFEEDFPFNYVTHYGEELQTSLFTARIWPTNMMMRPGQHIYFRFRSRESLTDEFTGRLQLNFVTERSTVLGLQLISETPERDREFIDKLCEIYLLQNVERKNMVAEKSIAFINGQLDVLQKSLTKSEGAMTNFRQENKFVDVNSYAGGLMSKASQYDQQQMALRLKETYLEYLTNYLDQKIEQGAVIAPSTLGLNEPILMQLVQQLNDLQIQRGELSEKNVFYAKYTTDIENVKSAIAEIVQSMTASLEIEKKDLHVRMQEVEREIRSLPEKELQMVAIERNYRIDDNYYTFFLQKRAEAEIQKAGNTPDSEIMDRARTTYAMNSKEKRKNTISYLSFGLLIPLLLIILSELLNNKIRTPKEAERLCSYDLLGLLRHVKSQDPTYACKRPRSSYAEMLRNVRMRIEFKVMRKTDLVVAVTSTQSGDGKTFISTNLAGLYSMTGHPTLLVDMDIRKPDVHEKLGLEAPLGVTNYLIGDCTLEDIIIHNDALGFDVIAAGTIPPNPGELVRSEKLAEMIKALRERYTYIVIDSSPVGIVPDAMALIELADITLYVLRCMTTDKRFAKQTLESLEEYHKDKVNLILSDIPTRKSGRGYGYSYGYGSKYSYGYGYGYGYGGYGYGYGYGKGKKHRYGFDYIRTKLSKKQEKSPYQYIEDDDE
jgi:capsular exopolysaccharide synthesis family protein